jgi:hypothetical protein
MEIATWNVDRLSLFENMVALTELAEKGYTEYAKEEQLKEIQEKVKKAVQMYESN